jgi:hypothetical protein
MTMMMMKMRLSWPKGCRSKKMPISSMPINLWKVSVLPIQMPLEIEIFPLEINVQLELTDEAGSE